MARPRFRVPDPDLWNPGPWNHPGRGPRPRVRWALEPVAERVQEEEEMKVPEVIELQRDGEDEEDDVQDERVEGKTKTKAIGCGIKSKRA